MPDTYPTFSHLATSAREGLDYRRELIDRGTDLVVIAPHGGGIEQGTSEIARAVAGRDLSLYTFSGLRRKGNGRLHITSTRFDEPRGLDLIARSRIVVAIHGLQEQDTAIYVGGRHQVLKARLLRTLRDAGFPALPAQGPHAGTHPANLCNRGSTGRGVQLELTRGLRSAMFHGLDRRGRRLEKPPFHRLTSAIRTVLLGG